MTFFPVQAIIEPEIFMRKILILLFTLSFFAFISCATKSKNEKNSIEDPVNIEELNNIKKQDIKKLDYSEKKLIDATEYLETNICYPVFSDKPLLNKYVENSILNYYKSFSAASKIQWNQQQEQAETSMPGSYSTNYSISSSKNYLTVLIETWIYEAGAPHGNIIYNTFCYNKNTKAIENDIQTISGLTIRQISEKVRPLVKKEIMKKGSEFYDEEWINSGTEPNPGNYEHFLVYDNKIDFFFEPYTVAPYAAGTVEVSIIIK